MYALAVLGVSVAPVAVFLSWLLYMDRREPEPLGLVLRVVGLGALGALVAMAVELALDALPLFHGQGLAAAFLVSFLQVAPVEELCKLAVVLLFVWKSPHFNEENDGIVYLGASSLGFALLENVAYVAHYGYGTGVLRAFSAIPLHMFTGVIMGYQVGLARMAGSPVVARRRVARGFLAAWLLHGLYDAFALSGQAWALLVLPIIGGVILAGTLFLRRGRALSLARWSGAGSVAGASTPAGVESTPVDGVGTWPAPAQVGGAARRGRPARPAARWMAVVGRLLLGACLLFWVLLVVGVATEEGAVRAGDTLLGGALLTFIPLGLGILLEVSYQRRRAKD